jgi:hypothetical protein
MPTSFLSFWIKNMEQQCLYQKAAPVVGKKGAKNVSGNFS